ncbi:PREDICTED: uncharacterized protein LOC105361473 [Ceratosolen solmsi marchali]|uniref:Uncharacterized protein LOC105361473 n=1 Tax=Ceratosolen solmsi marchali TaxID=326594 RepID=A0AAJ7DUK7_9HYME|nr:PREDICTED: uncharacterized protein LOC105361473 [Ceratosolen solmsi marchali]
MTPYTVFVFLALSLIITDIIPVEARYKSYQRRRASRFLRQRRQFDEDLGDTGNAFQQKLIDVLIPAVSQTIYAIVNDPAFGSCTSSLRRRNANYNSNTNINTNTFADAMGRQGDLDELDIIDDDPEIVGDEDIINLNSDDIEDDIASKRSIKRRLLRARRRNRNSNVNVNQNYNASARKEETNTNPSAEASNEEETTTEVSNRRRRRNFK